MSLGRLLKPDSLVRSSMSAGKLFKRTGAQGWIKHYANKVAA